MNDIDGKGDFDRNFVHNMVESALRIGLIFILLLWSYDIIKPFIIPIIWGGIIAIAAMPLINSLEKKFGGRRGLAVTLFTLAGILVLVVPIVLLIISVIEPLEAFAAAVEQGSLQIPRPTARLASIPLVGDQLYQTWTLASTNLEAFLTKMQPQLQGLAISLLTMLGGGVTSILMFIISLLIAAGFMVGAEGSAGASERIATRLLGEQGGEWVTMCTATVRSVLQGVIGVAVIQTFLVAIGLFAVGLPAAGLWTVGVLILAIAQVPPLILLLPIIIYVFSYASTTIAIVFAIWSVLAGASDTVLKPMMMGRGLDVPMPIILLGAIGGMITAGIIGLFMGAVILAVWYKMFQAWIKQQAHP